MAKDIRKIVKQGYEKGNYASYFRANPQPNELEKKFLDCLIGLIPKAAKILDFGCGTGIPFDKYLADRGFKITGVDITPKHLKQARKNVPNAKFIEGDFSRINFVNQRFHAIIALYSIFHIPREEQQNLFQKMHRLLENDGVALITLGTEEGDSIKKHWHGAPMAWSSHKLSSYRTMITRTNFEIIKSEYEGQPGEKEYHWWVIIKKK